MGSKFIIAITVVIFLLFLFVDVFAHGHFSEDSKRRKMIEKVEAAGIETLKDFDVSVEDRTAVLHGDVDTAEERRHATEEALQVPGLLTVYNDLRVDAIDEELLSLLKKQQDADGTRGEFAYRIGPDPHSVTLDGWVPADKPELKDALEQLVRRMPGVRNVINNIGLGQDQIVIDINSILKLGNIYFDYNKWDIRPESVPSVEKIAKLLMSDRYKDVRMRIEGHTDSTASRKYNQMLSEKRAGAVRDMLVAKGVAADRLESVGKGEDEPISPNLTPEGRANNRRIEFHVIHGNLVPPEDVDRLAAEAQRKNATEPVTTSEPGVSYRSGGEQPASATAPPASK